MHKIFTNTNFIGRNVIYLPNCHSTNDIAAEILSKKELSEGTIIITDHQTAGKGQRGNIWEAEEGKNLTLSLLLKPRFLDISEQFFLNIIISLSIHDLLTQYIHEGIAIKWPNDIYFYDNKLGGILIENILKKNQIDISIVGIGLNINQKSFKHPHAVSLANICNQQFVLDDLLGLLLIQIERNYAKLKKGELEELRRQYLQSLYWYNEKRTFLSDGEFDGEIKGIDEMGRLIIQENNALKYFNHKEVTFVR